MNTICKVEGCDTPARYVKVCMCQKHAYRLRVHGSTDKPTRELMPLADKLRRAVQAGLMKAEEVGDCLEWQGPFACKETTPVVKARHAGKKRTENFSVPRLLWEAKRGPIPAGKLVYRRCHNNACVLDEHLMLGTRKEWFASRKRAGLTKHSTATLVRLTVAARRRLRTVNTMEKAREVRQLAAAKVRNVEIVQRTGVSPAMVAEMRQGTAWREMGSPFSGLGARS